MEWKGHVDTPLEEKRRQAVALQIQVYPREEYSKGNDLSIKKNYLEKIIAQENKRKRGTEPAIFAVVPPRAIGVVPAGDYRGGSAVA
jgi:hypothetical protein